MFETLESRRMMSVSTSTIQEPVVQSTTSSIDASTSAEFSMLQSAFSSALKSIGEGITAMARKAAT